MSGVRSIKPGCSLRLELHVKKFAVASYHLSLAELGKLFQMLMAEVAQRPIPRCKNRFVLEVFAQRLEYSRIRGSFGRANLPLAIRRLVFERDGRACRYCGAGLTWSNFHCDHVKPVARGGRDNLRNLAAACRPCNLSKAAKTVQEWCA